jgi:group I intron endonuclease
MSNQSGIYKITNILNNHCYIGSAVNINRRFIIHRYKLNDQTHHSSYFQNAWNKYGSEAFIYEVLLYCSELDLIFYEQRAIDTYKPEYNMCPTAGSSLGRKLTEQHKSKISASLKGHKHSEESKVLMSKNRAGKDIPAEARARQAATLRGRKTGPASQERKDAISKALKGHKLSQETKDKIAEKAKARNMSGENNPNFGKKMSQETRDKMSAVKKQRAAERKAQALLDGVALVGNRKGQPVSKETRIKIKDGLRRRKAASSTTSLLRSNDEV